MPTYDYRCGACGHTFEKFESITASPSRKCPQCGRMKLRRLIGAGAGVIFKGSGFYQTDYRSDAYRKAADKDASAGKDKTSEKSADKTAKKDSSGESESTGKKTSD